MSSPCGSRSPQWPKAPCRLPERQENGTSRGGLQLPECCGSVTAREVTAGPGSSREVQVHWPKELAPEVTGCVGMKQLNTPALLIVSVFALAACGGGGGGNNGGGVNVTISGKITFDRVPFKSTVGTGLDFATPVISPARQVIVEAVQPGNVLGGETVLTSTVTDTNGDYSLQVPANRSLFIRAKARMEKTGSAPTWTFQVLNNTNSDALYVLDGIASSSGGSNSTRNLHAASGWGTSSYTGTRAAAPFAILDTIYKMKELVLTANANTAFPALDLYWSVSNRSGSGSQTEVFCPDTGDIVSSLYVVFGAGGVDGCATQNPGRSGVYVLGSYPADTDEFDEHVIAHEVGHYFENEFSRSDSIGGRHTFTELLDIRVAFGEGWGNAFGAMVLNDPQYRDSLLGANQEAHFNIESDFVQNPGWYSEFSVHKLLWDWFDPANESDDSVALGFGPIYAVMTGPQRSTTALTSIFSFTRALKAANVGANSGINTLLAGHGINPITDDYGTSETNFPGNSYVLPLYTDIAPGGQLSLCGTVDYGKPNKLANRRFLRFVSNSAQTISVTVTGATGSDPDVEVWSAGSVTIFDQPNSTTESFQLSVGIGTYVIEIYDYNLLIPTSTITGSTTCMNVSIAG